MPLSCIELNSESTVRNYTVRYGRASSGDRTTVNLPASSTTFTISNLEPGTRYSIEVAPVNSNGEMGKLSPPIVQATDDDGMYLATGTFFTSVAPLSPVEYCHHSCAGAQTFTEPHLRQGMPTINKD